MVAAAAFLALFIVLSFSRHVTSDAGDVILTNIMAVTVWPGMATVAMILPSSFRISIAWALRDWLRPLAAGRYPSLEQIRRKAATRQQRGEAMARRPRLWRFLLWFVTPSNGDIVTGVVFALLFAPLINADTPTYI